jgi:hypothetical protein
VEEKICFGPEYSFFQGDDLQIVDFDFVGHYIFETSWVGIYPLLGANYTIEQEGKEHIETRQGFGVVFGLGVHRNFSRFTIFAEYSRIEWGITDQFITAGIMYNFF